MDIFTTQKNEVFYSECDQIRSILWIWSHLLKKSLMENFIFCAMILPKIISIFFQEKQILTTNQQFFWGGAGSNNNLFSSSLLSCASQYSQKNKFLQVKISLPQASRQKKTYFDARKIIQKFNKQDYWQSQYVFSTMLMNTCGLKFALQIGNISVYVCVYICACVVWDERERQGERLVKASQPKCYQKRLETW